LRLLIGQGAGLRFLVPLAIAHVEVHPLASGDFYPGDLLKQVMEVDEGFWNEHRDCGTDWSRLSNGVGKN
jgi:contact-dependent growth inhibition (CDI) system CdiI-like immunity protein